MVLSVLCPCLLLLFFFFFNDTATTEIYTLSLHDALPISAGECEAAERSVPALRAEPRGVDGPLGVGVEDRHVRRGAGREAPAPQAEEPCRIARKPGDERRERQEAGTHEPVQQQGHGGLEPDDVEGGRHEL